MTTATMITDIADLRMDRFLANLQAASDRDGVSAGWLRETTPYGTESAILARRLQQIAGRVEQLLRTWSHLFPQEPRLSAATGSPQPADRTMTQDQGKQRSAA